jgi:hypothetical protein
MWLVILLGVAVRGSSRAKDIWDLRKSHQACELPNFPVSIGID